MKYFKLIKDGTFIGIGTSYDLRRYQVKHRIILASDEDDAQYIQVGDTLYRDEWLSPLPEGAEVGTEVRIIVIDETEYNVLYEAMESGEEIDIPEEPEPIVEEEPTDQIYETTFEFIKSSKIKEMSNVCNQIITNGFDTILSDGEQHHFSLTIQDQLNLITLSSLVSSGEQEIPYHADDELCKYYSAQDIMTIVAKATEFKTYHVTYFNSLKAYIESIDNIEDTSRIVYGVDIPEEYQSEILKGLLVNE